jgi:hypothetical protein
MGTPADWQIGASVQQELLPRVSVEVGYFRRWLQNFLVTDNLSVLASDFDTFSVTAPLDPRLPGGGGYVVSDLYNVVPAKFGQTNNLITQASTFGDPGEVYNGFDIFMNARLKRGVLISGGTSTGRTQIDQCFKLGHPEYTFTDAPVPVDAVLGEVGQGFDLTGEWFIEERVHIAARCCGACDRLIELGTEWALEREQFGGRIFDHQAISFMLADCAAEVTAARLFGIAAA